MAMSGQAIPSASSSAAMLSALTSASPVEAVVGGVVIGVAALGILTYKAIIKAENKAYMAQVEKAQDLYTKFLSKSQWRRKKVPTHF